MGCATCTGCSACSGEEPACNQPTEISKKNSHSNKPEQQRLSLTLGKATLLPQKATRSETPIPAGPYSLPDPSCQGRTELRGPYLLVWELLCMNQLRLLSTYMAQALSSLPSMASFSTSTRATPKAGSGWLS